MTRGPYKTGSRLAGKTKGKSVSFQLQENSTFGVPDRTTQWDDALQAGEDPSWLLGQNKSEENMSWFSQAYDHDFNRAKQYKMAIGDYYASDLYTADDREVQYSAEQFLQYILLIIEQFTVVAAVTIGLSGSAGGHG